MAERIIDRLEAIEVDDQQRAARFGIEGVGQRARQIFIEAEAIGQAGEVVEARHFGDLFGDRAEQEFSQAALAMAADDDEVDAQFPGFAVNRFGNATVRTSSRV